MRSGERVRGVRAAVRERGCRLGPSREAEGAVPVGSLRGACGEPGDSPRAAAASPSAERVVPRPRGQGPAPPPGRVPRPRGRGAAAAAVSRAEGLAGSGAGRELPAELAHVHGWSASTADLG